MNSLSRLAVGSSQDAEIGSVGFSRFGLPVQCLKRHADFDVADHIRGQCELMSSQAGSLRNLLPLPFDTMKLRKIAAPLSRFRTLAAFSFFEVRTETQLIEFAPAAQCVAVAVLEISNRQRDCLWLCVS